MSLGSHPVTRSALSRSITSNLLAGPRDPLLFLYPRWFASSAIKVPPATAKEAAALQASGSTPKEATQDGHAIQLLSAPRKLQDTPPGVSRIGEKQRILAITRGALQPSARGSSNLNRFSSGHSTRTLSSDTSVRHQKSDHSATTTGPDEVIAPSYIQPTSPGDVGESVGPIVEDVSISKPKAATLLRIVRAAKRRQNHLADKESVKLQLNDKGKHSFDWRVPLKVLERHTQVNEVHHGQGDERFLIHEQFLQAFAGDIGETIWDIKAGSGCEVYIQPRDKRSNKYRPGFLRGSPSSIDLAKEAMSSLIHRLLPDATALDGDKALFGIAAEEYKEAESSLARKVWTDRNVLRQIRVDKIPSPKVWTRLSLANYVEALAKSKVSRLMHRHLYSTADSHALMVSQRLRMIFMNPQHDGIISIRAFNAALTFLYKNNMVATARNLFIRMEQLKLRMIPETFNIMLRGAAANKDLQNFTFLLKLMIRRDVKPNPGTWVALVMTIASRAVQMRIESVMREKGLLDNPATVKELTAQIIAGQFSDHLASGQDVQSFFEQIDRNYSPLWVSVSALNQMLEIMGERGSFSEALNILELVRDRDIFPNTVSLNTLISHCRRQGDLAEAVQLLQHFHSHFRVWPDEVTYHILFMLSWESRRYNACRTIWRHGCMESAVSYRMQELVLRSLLRNTPSVPKTKNERWTTSAGKVVVGIARTSGAMSRELRWSEKGVQRMENVRIAKDILGQDLTSLRSYRPAEALVHQLEKALILDQSWYQENLWMDTSTIWKMENAIDTPVLPRYGRRLTKVLRLNLSALSNP